MTNRKDKLEKKNRIHKRTNVKIDEKEEEKKKGQERLN